ncbi:hypothetical protein CDD83_4495 [Cordyceps sp. RAO-2017]|nr:hypothetical protein CDD83_4495 [Cordyceps sp. RAO-2017]
MLSRPRKPQNIQPFSGSPDEDTLTTPLELSGVSYAPYRADHGCKSKHEIEKDFQHFAASYSIVRIYGTDCDQVAKVYAAAKAHGMKIFLGIWDPSSAIDEAEAILAGVNGDWDRVHTVSVGNELVNSDQARPVDMAAAVIKVRSFLRQKGYKGPVVTVDTFTAYLSHPQLGQVSDYCAVNAHAFFDPTISAPESGRWLRETVERVKTACPGSKKVVVTETGWPTKGDPNGRAVPSISNQRFAMDSIKHEFSSDPGDVIFFSAFNDLWKKREQTTFNADQFWGIDGAVSTSDQ